MRAKTLKRRSDFGRVFARGRTVGDRYMILFVLSTGADRQRIGFAAQRSAGNAVRRNRIRRRLRALYHLFAGDVYGGYDIVVLGKTIVYDAPWGELVKSMRRLLHKAGCLPSGLR